MLKAPDIEALVHANIAELLAEAGGEQSSITGADSLYDIGLTSLVLARLIIQLETEVGVDPFAENLVLSDVRTVDDLIGAYRTAAGAVVAG